MNELYGDSCFLEDCPDHPTNQKRASIKPDFTSDINKRRPTIHELIKEKTFYNG